MRNRDVQALRDNLRRKELRVEPENEPTIRFDRDGLVTTTTYGEPSNSILKGRRLRVVADENMDPQPGLVIYVDDTGAVTDVTFDDGPVE